MASPSFWNAQHIFHQYLLDYLWKNEMHETAEIFRREACVYDDHVGIDVPKGFLPEWWSVFYEAYNARQPKHVESWTEVSSKARNAIANQPRNVHAVVEKLASDQQMPRSFPICTDFDKMIGQPAAKIFKEGHLRCPRSDFDSNSRFPNVNKMNILKLTASSSSHLQQQICSQAPQLVMGDDRHDFNLGRTSPVEPALYGAGRAILPIPQPFESVVNERLDPVLLNEWPSDAPNNRRQLPMSTLQHQSLHFAPRISTTQGNLTSIFFGSPADFACENLILPGINLSLMNAQMVAPMRQDRGHQLHHDLQLQEDCKNAEDKPSVDDDVEAFLSYDDLGDSPRNPSRIFKHQSAAHGKHKFKGFTFEEVGCRHLSKNKISCCHFSSDGKLLASAGHEKKVFIWDMETSDFINASNGHSLLITDVRFKPKSTIFATSSFDRTVQIWDAAKPSNSLFKLVGHSGQVMSLDFHPAKIDLLCSMDINDEIGFWNIDRCTCNGITKLQGAAKQVRFQPPFGNLLAASIGNSVNLTAVETGRFQFCLKGHSKEVISLCWDSSGKYIASVSEDSARVWSIELGGKCLHELHAFGNKFRSCTFHPRYSQLLILGGYQSIELWNPTESCKTWRIHAHNGLIPSLAASVENQMVASASHDQCVKLWK